MVIEINKKNCHANQPIKWLEMNAMPNPSQSQFLRVQFVVMLISLLEDGLEQLKVLACMKSKPRNSLF
jgi:hypothetical protein